jgi:hypothetical protein
MEINDLGDLSERLAGASRQGFSVTAKDTLEGGFSSSTGPDRCRDQDLKVL